MADSTIDEVAPLIIRPPRPRVSTMTDIRTPFRRQLAVFFILVSAGFERLAFYSLIGNLVIFLKSDNIGWSSVNSVTASLIFLGTSYLSAIFFAWLSDGKVGRAKTIIVGYVLYTVAYIFIPLLADNNKYGIRDTLCHATYSINSTYLTSSLSHEYCFGSIITVLIFIAIGVGAVQANMAVFGAEQVQEQKATTQYFDKYYAAVNTGGLIAFGVIAYVQQNVGYFYGYIVPTALLILAATCFLIGYPFYIHVQPYDSVISTFIPVVVNASQNWWQQRKNVPTRANNFQRAASPTLSSEYSQNSDQRSMSISQSASFLDYAKAANNGRYVDRIVDDIKSVRRILVVFLLLIPYWLLYFQIETTFLVQGLHMIVPTFSQAKGITMPVIWLSLSDQVIIIVTIFLLNTFVYKRLHASGRSFSIKTRITIGMISAALAMCAAGTVEIFRQNACDKIHPQTIGNTTYLAADLSIFVQFPQYIGVGLSEVFASVASLEFAYLAAPRSAQSLIMSLRFCSAGLSSFFGSAYVNIFATLDHQFDFENQNCKPTSSPEMFYIYFFILAGVQLIFALVFLLCNRKFNILKISQHRFNTRLYLAPSEAGTSTA